MGMWHGAVIGSGPAAFYTVRRLLERNKNIMLTMFERGRYPFGLIRKGVAPDHPELKQLQNIFLETLLDSRVQFFANFLASESLRYDEYFHFIVDARGADVPNRLDFLDYSSTNVLDSSELIGWINGSLSLSKEKLTMLLDSRSILIIGQGNVALDAARFFLSDPSHYLHGDIGYSPLKFLACKESSTVTILGRRPPEKVQMITCAINLVDFIFSKGIEGDTV